MSSFSRCLRIGAACILVGALAVPAVSAAEPVAAKLTITLPSAPIVCRQETEVSVLVVDAGGATIAGKEVSWGLAPVVSSQDGITESTSLTGSQGVATTRVWIDCIPGARTLLVKSDDAIASQVLAISADGMPAATPTPPPATVAAAKLTITLPSAPIACGHLTEVSVLATDGAGATIAGKTVAWTLMPFASTQDSWTDMESVTGSQGVAMTQVWIDCVPGRRTINVSADGVTASADLAISEEGMPAATAPVASEPASGTTAPPTSTAPAIPEQGSVPAGLLLFAAAGLVALAGSLLAVARSTAHR
jgi:hypothetical protein